MQVRRRLRVVRHQARDAVVLGAEIGIGAGAGVEDQGKVVDQLGAGQGTLAHLGVLGQRLVAELGQQGGRDLEPARGGVEAGRAVGAQQPLFPLAIGHHRGVAAHPPAGLAHLLQGKARARQDEALHVLPVSGEAVPVAQPRG